MPFRLAGLLPKLPWPGSARGRIGVDIGSAAVNLLLWQNSASLPDCAIQPLPAGAVVNRGIRDVGAVGRAIAAAASALRVSGRDAVTAVPASAVMQRRLETDTDLPDAELEAQVMLEAERHVPWPLAEVCLDFCCLEPAANEAGQVLLTVCRREQVEVRQQALILGGLRPAAVDVEHHAMERALSLLKRDEGERATAIADIGASTICLHVLAGGRSVHCEERPFNCNEQLRGEPAAYAGALVRQLAQTLQVFHSSSSQGPATKVARVFLCGAGALAGDLIEPAGRYLKLPVELANPFPAAGRLAGKEPALLLAAGLAAPGDRHD